jgi:hypothetical protein
MSESNLLGIYEIAEIAGVNPSAVANWRRRFPDFPSPVAELKSGPVFHATQINLWLQRRNDDELENIGTYYDQLAAKRGDSPELAAAIEETVKKLLDQNMPTSTRKPGILLGKIQSGKTRAFLGVIARAFDRGYGVAVILTKGTKSLTRQTLSRVKKDFNEFIKADEIQVFDIMTVPDLTPYELNQKLIFIVKKEDDNMERLLGIIQNKYPDLRKRKVLIIDDEADLASISFRKGKDGVIGVGTISGQIDKLRELVVDSDFLQVTATPYSLYLQPNVESADTPLLFHPKRPSFTVVLPIHDKYIGGDYYFEKSATPDSPAYYFYHEVPLAEREALKTEDRRRFHIENVMTEKNVAVLREAMATFIVAGTIRRLQQQATHKISQKYSFLFHTESSRKSHEWQEKTAEAIYQALEQGARENSSLFDELLRKSYNDLQRSIKLDKLELPAYETVKREVISVILSGQLMITKVNSDKDIDELLDEDGQLSLRTPLNMFIGGQILDRGITINNLIAFYYGRNPKKFQQDTVLQHSRMYGARTLADLSVTRFYAPQHIYQLMSKIHEFDSALREAFIKGAHDRGVYFIQKDLANHLVPCSPNKLYFSKVISIRPGRRLLPVGFQTVSKTNGQKNLQILDKKIHSLTPGGEGSVLISSEHAVELLNLAYANLEFEDLEDELKAYAAALEHLSRISKNSEQSGKVLLITARDRNVARYREQGRFSNAPDTKQQQEEAGERAKDIPVLELLRQNGTESQGWRDLPFWWPVVIVPIAAVTSIFATDKPKNHTALD